MRARQPVATARARDHDNRRGVDAGERSAAGTTRALTKVMDGMVTHDGVAGDARCSDADEQWVVWRDLASEAEWAMAELVALAVLPAEKGCAPATVAAGAPREP